jgi:hypothetical protein
VTRIPYTFLFTLIGAQVDYLTQRLPVNEVVQVFGFSEKAANCNQFIIAIRRDHPELTTAIVSTKIDGFGQSKLCASLQTTMQILWMLPRNERVIAFRSK